MTIRNILLLSALSLCLTLPAFAQDAKRIEPLHIKMGSAQKGNKGINIIKGALRPAAPEKTKKEEKEVSQQKSSAIKSPKPAPHIISKRTCVNGMSEMDTRKMADSLRVYLSKRNQDTNIIDDILYASQTAGVDFDLMVVKALIESDLGRLTIAKKSSARGVYQYIDATWLILLERYKDRIGQDFGQDFKENRFDQKEKLSLRDNPRLSALIKAYQTHDDAQALKSIKTNGVITVTDHYIIHMLGQPLAKEFYAMQKNESHIIPANMEGSTFARAAQLNPAFFNGQDGNALNAAEAYQQFHDKIARKYDFLRKIYATYGDDNIMPENSCTLPNIKTAKL